MEPRAPDVATRPSREGAPRLLVVLFGVYLLLLVWLVLWKLEVPWIGSGELRRVKLVPFAPTATAGASTVREAVANVAFFIPFGVYLPLLAPRRRWWTLLAVVAGSSLALEVVQYLLAIGSSDVTDVITNTAGGLAGMGLLTLIRRRLQDRTRTVMTRVCTVGTVLALLAAGIFVASPLHYGPRAHDAHRPSASAR